jgi:2-keto-4-pentenoate hydratase/2-oxohepta-3-ene-1,7-dioic acid hydratase in catechol pathway
VVTLAISGSADTFSLRPGKIIALGLNYRDHVAESLSVIKSGNTDLPTEPILFSKTPNVLIGPGEDIVIPTGFLLKYGFPKLRTDFEAELAVIIGKGGRNIPASEARSHIFGYTCFNDVSQRNIQNSDRSGWYRGKSFDTFGPIGPLIVPDAQIGDPQNLDIECRLNGLVVQKSNTRNMIFPIDLQIAFISSQITLEAGDIIVTGTPSGVGPLRQGDVVEVEIQGIGILRNAVREE